MQIRQGHFYLDDKSMVSDILVVDSSPISFETDVQPVSLYILCGTKKIILSVDSTCKIGDIKRRASKVRVQCYIDYRFLSYLVILWIYLM